MRIVQRVASLGLLVVAVALMTTAPTSMGQGLENAVEVTFNVDTLRLASGETGTIVLDICNTADVPLYVDVDFSRLETGTSRGTVSDELFLLEPGEVRRVLVTVESHAHLNQDDDVSDFKISIHWGANASGDRVAHPWGGQWQHEFDVVDIEPVWAGWICPGLFVLIVAVIGLVLYLVFRSRRRGAQPGPPL